MGVFNMISHKKKILLSKNEESSTTNSGAKIKRDTINHLFHMFLKQSKINKDEHVTRIQTVKYFIDAS